MKVFVVEDSPIVRDRLVAMLWDVRDVEVVGEADNPEDAIGGILRAQPHAIVLDIKLRGGSGISVLEAVKRQAPSTVAIMLTNYANPEFKQKCLGLGADFFFDKTADFEKVKDVLEDLRKSGQAA